ncbi:MAG TPA: 50S ribosomal protein L11 methyltransferase, partial [Hyphomonadaceae bacterium]|nr:50S ribosomal protein L11 methyltransferase [Hyphomonadaceae bacterium]
MYRVHCLLPRSDAERLSTVLSEMDPSPASAVSVEEASKVSWSLDAFCIDEELANEAAAIIEREIPEARPAVQKLDDKDWVAVSLAGLPAVNAGPFVVAGWHELAHLEGGKIPVWIEAGPAFGTGHHGTTKGCLEALAVELKRKRPQRVLDIGTGSGVLALAAVKYGAGSPEAACAGYQMRTSRRRGSWGFAAKTPRRLSSRISSVRTPTAYWPDGLGSGQTGNIRVIATTPARPSAINTPENQG